MTCSRSSPRSVRARCEVLLGVAQQPASEARQHDGIGLEHGELLGRGVAVDLGLHVLSNSRCETDFRVDVMPSPPAVWNARAGTTRSARAALTWFPTHLAPLDRSEDACALSKKYGDSRPVSGMVRPCSTVTRLPGFHGTRMPAELPYQPV